MRLIKKIAPVVIMVIGLALVLYPWISEYLYEYGVQSLVESYESDNNDMDDSEKEEQLRLAREYNEALLKANIKLTDPFSLEDQAGGEFNYDSILNYNKNGVMGFIDIPKIDVYLPIYHGTSNEVLEKGIGHLENTSFPIGGESTHAVISGHTGLNSAKMFTDLTSMELDDQFYIDILGDTLAYKVINIEVVEPDDVSSLSIQDGKDLVTLVTCTPYGINSHRLLVTGERTEYIKDEHDAYKVSGDTEWMKSYERAILIGLALVIALFVISKFVKLIRSKISVGGKNEAKNH